MAKRLIDTADKAQFRKFIAAMFSSESAESIQGDLAELAIPRPFRLRMKVLYLPGPLSNQFDALVNAKAIQTLSNGAPGYILRSPRGEKTHRKTTTPFAVLPTAIKNIRVLVAIEERIYWLSLLRFIRNQYPRIVPIYLSQRELVDGVRRLRDTATGFILRVREITAKEDLRNRHRPKSVREWTDEELKNVLADVVNRNQILTSIRVGFYRRMDEHTNVSPTAITKVTKNGEVEVSGQFRLAWSTVIEHIAIIGSEKLRFYSNRGLRSRQYRAAPLQIRFSQPVFDDVEDVQQLVGILETYPHSMHSVQHGNPYIHLRISDTYDGSAFDVWAVSQNSLVIVPRLQASEASIERLTHYVFDKFREGEVLDFKAD